MTEAVKPFELKFASCRRGAARRAETLHNKDGSPQSRTAQVAGSPARDSGMSVVVGAVSGPAPQGELDRLHLSLSAVTPANHPRTARLLASSTRKAAQKVIEEAGEVALEAVRHRALGIVRESADLLYHLVALWHRAGIDPADIWIEMRTRADTLGIAEKRPKTRKAERE